MFISVIGVIVGAGIASLITFQVFYGDVSELEKSTILSRINEETTIYTLDEKTKIGSFFDESHRNYVPIDNVPAHMIRAMVASEDKNFYSHLGVDPVAIGSAFFDGVLNGFRFRRGGSSITQQTVKNILDKREHTFSRKFKEMIRAFQLERMYSKQQILEFYLNQFHVTANGKGVGIAAEYYFNKDVRDLNLVEAAFIAGSVKAPSKYNPFIKYTRESRKKAWLEANRRKNYVLRRMYEQGWITQEELKDAWKKRVPFNKGKFRSQEVALVSLIRSQLNKEEIIEALGVESMEDINSAGFKIFTTIDHELQKVGQLAMRRNLSRLEEILQGYRTEPPEEFSPLRNLEKNQFYFAKVEKINRGAKPSIDLDFGLPKGVIPYESLMRAAKIYNLPTYKGYEHHLKEIIDNTKVGDVLFVEVLEYDEETHEAVCELRKKPTINGGLIAVDKGEVRAVVSGFDAKGYNRAMFATRQPGSVFKSVIYFAALQLGWTILDRIDNERRLFPFQGSLYVPRPDHESPYKDVSLLWSGVKSENVATVNLTANLLDKLNFDEFKTLMGDMGLLPEDDESPPEFHYRVAKAVGVQLENSGIREYLLGKVIEDLRPDLVFAGRLDLMRLLSKLWWGRGYVEELKNLYEMKPEDISDRERGIREVLIKRNYERLSQLSDGLSEDWALISDSISNLGAEGVFADPDLGPVLSRFRVMNSIGGQPTLAYFKELAGEEIIQSVNAKLAIKEHPGRALNPLDAQAIWGGFSVLGGSAGLQLEDVMLSGFMPLLYLNRIKSSLERRYNEVISLKDRYSLYQYFNHHDFRITLGLHYLKRLSRSMGVYSNIEPVLSFGLGTNDVSVAEVAKIYQTFTNGKIYRFYEKGPLNQLSLIRRIEDREGEVLYEAQPDEFQLTDSCYASQMTEILQKVVTHGTGRRARGELHIEVDSGTDGVKKKNRIRIPAFGKTGTTNDYTTAYFAGFIPFPVEQGAQLDTNNNSLIIASYVGYDMNKTMRRGNFRISGAYGALPVWTDFAKEVIRTKSFDSFLDTFDLKTISKQVWPIKRHQCATKTKVDLARGTMLREGDQSNEIYDFTNFERDGEFFQNEFARNQTVRSTLNLAAIKSRNGLTARRAFQPFQKLDEDPTDVKIIKGNDEPDSAQSPMPRRRTRRSQRTPSPGQTNLAPLDKPGVIGEQPGQNADESRAQIEAVEANPSNRRDENAPKRPINKEKEKKVDDNQQGGFEEEELW